MTKTPHDITPQAVVEFSQKLLRELAETYGGDCTLNEIRVMNQVIRCSLEGRTCCVTALHRVTGIPIPTVSRSVTNLQDDGWLSDRRDPADGRKRIISLGPRSQQQATDDINGRIRWINEFRENGVPN